LGGAAGGDGTSGTSGLQGLDGNLSTWRLISSTDTGTDPGSGNFALSSGLTWGTTTTSIAIDNVSYDPAINFSSYLDYLQPNTVIKIVKNDDKNTYKILLITGTAPFEAGYEQFTVSQIASAGPDPDANDVFYFNIIGVSGSSGTSGTSASSGTAATSGETAIYSGTSGTTETLPPAEGTTTTTTTTGALFAGTVQYSSTDVCTSVDGTLAVTGNAVLFCDCTEFSGASIAGLPTGTYTITTGVDKVMIICNGSSVANNNTYPSCDFC
jgi:hypothetical protein